MRSAIHENVLFEVATTAGDLPWEKGTTQRELIALASDNCFFVVLTSVFQWRHSCDLSKHFPKGLYI